MKIAELIAFMETVAPPTLAAEWDNIGLLVGDRRGEVTTVVVALDATPAAIAYAKAQGAQLLVTHHPAIFSPLRTLSPDSPAYQLASNGIALYAAHTNLDTADGGVNDALAQLLGLHRVQPFGDGMGRIGYLRLPLTPQAFAELVAAKLHTAVQLHDGQNSVQRVALLGGAGGDAAVDCGADAFLTGEMKHHEWLALPSGLTVVAAGHYATENGIVAPLAARLAAQFSALRVLPFEDSAPYRTVTNR